MSGRYRIIEDDQTGSHVLALLQLHLEEMHQWSPPESVHAMPAERLRQADVNFFSAWDGDSLACVGAIKELDPLRGELKSMRADPAWRGKGAGRAILLYCSIWQGPADMHGWGWKLERPSSSGLPANSMPATALSLARPLPTMWQTIFPCAWPSRCDTIRRCWQEAAMAVTGIGGFFFRARDPAALGAWYATHLGVGTGPYGMWDTAAGPCVFSPFPADSDYFAADRPWMLNLRVSDLDGLADSLGAAGIEVTTNAEWDMPGVGRFARVIDPEGNPVELWQPDAPPEESPAG